LDIVTHSVLVSNVRHLRYMTQRAHTGTYPKDDDFLLLLSYCSVKATKPDTEDDMAWKRSTHGAALRFVDSETGTVRKPDYSTGLPTAPVDVMVRSRGGNPPARLPDANICDPEARGFAERIRDVGHGVLRVAARTQGHNHTLWSRALEAQRDLYTRAYNVQWGNADGKAELRKARKVLQGFYVLAT
jgi:hypothetical protein